MGTTGIEWSSIRWSRLRWDFVDALIRSSRHTGDRSPHCDESCCRALRELLRPLGLNLRNESAPGLGRIQHRPEHAYSVGSSMQEALWTLSALLDHGSIRKRDLWKGWLEVPEVVGTLIHSDYFSRHMADEVDVHTSHEPADERREVLYGLALLALPDDYLEFIHRSRGSTMTSYLAADPTDSPCRGEAAYLHLQSRFAESRLLVPKLSPAVIDWLEWDGITWRTSHFDPENGCWPMESPYFLDVDDESSLLHYRDAWPSLPDAFGFFSRGNGYGEGLCFMSRSSRLFVSHQVWQSFMTESPGFWNRSIEAYNEHLAPVIERDDLDDASTMVAFSTFRDYAFIVSSEPESWDEFASQGDALPPLPEGHGIVGVWSQRYLQGDERYRPRSLDSVIAAGYSASITACARYLRECLGAFS